MSESGIGFEIGEQKQLPSELFSQASKVTTAPLLCHGRGPQLATSRRTHALGAKFVSGERDLLNPSNLTPRSKPTRKTSAISSPWRHLTDGLVGDFSPRPGRPHLRLPQVQGMSTFRSGCRSCGSIHVASHQLIHHFDCSYLGRINEFEKDGTIACPKCGVKGRSTGKSSKTQRALPLP